MLTSKLTSKGQTTIPRTVRMALRLRPGDRIAYAIKNGRALVTRSDERALADDPVAAFPERNRAADAEVSGKQA
jgi:antitoxin PrlF